MPSGQVNKVPVPSRKMALFLFSKIKISREMFRDFVHGTTLLELGGS